MTSFSGKLVWVLLDNRGAPAIRAGRSLLAVQRPFPTKRAQTRGSDRDPGRLRHRPSVSPPPRLVLRFPDRPWFKAAVIPDFLYGTQGSGY